MGDSGMQNGRIAVSAVAVLLLAAASPALAAGIAERESVGPAGQQADGYSVLPSVSGDGALVVFNTAAHNLVAKDPNRWPSDILLRDRVGRTTSLVSVSTAGAKADGRNGVALISRDGKRVFFESAATNLTDGDSRGRESLVRPWPGHGRPAAGCQVYPQKINKAVTVDAIRRNARMVRR